MEKGFLKNCFIKARGDDTLFVADPNSDDFRCRLDGYAIIPKEEYESLIRCHCSVCEELLSKGW